MNEKKAAKKKQRTHGTAFYVAITMLVLLVVAGGAMFAFYRWITPYRNYAYILPNVFYDGVDLSGMTREQATEAIETEMGSRSYSLTIAFPDGASYILTPPQETQTVDVGAVVDAAWAYGRASLQPLQMYHAIKAAKGSTYEIPANLSLTYDAEVLRQQVDQFVTEISIAPGSATGTGDKAAQTVTVTPGSAGRTADADAIYAAACQAFDTMKFETIQASYEDVPVDLPQLTELVASLHKEFTVETVETAATVDATAHTIQLTKGTPGYSFNEQAVIDTVVERTSRGDFTPYTIELSEQLPQNVSLETLLAPLESEPTEVEYHDGGLTGGDSGYTADAEAAQETFDGLDWGESTTITMEEVLPEHTLEEMEGKLFRDVLASYSTPYVSDSNRTTNLRLACAEINGTVLNADSTFSFNTIVGERTAAKGYRSATVYVDGKAEDDDGGGICQVASTLYNAALYADLEVTDRLAHQFLVTYVPGGLDATVYWGVQDFCFKNTTEYPIKITANIDGGSVNIKIYGTNDTGKYVELSSSMVSSDSKTIVYDAYQYVYYSDGSLMDKRELGTSTYERHGG